MLADDLISRPPLGITRGDFDKLQHQLRLAHRFDIDPNFAEAAGEIAASKMESVEKVLPLCKSPYKASWFEVAASQRIDRIPLTNSRATLDVDRIGLLVQEIESTELLLISLFWRDKRGNTFQSHISQSADFSSHGVSRFEPGSELAQNLEYVKEQFVRTLPESDTASRRASMARVYGRIIAYPSEFTKGQQRLIHPKQREDIYDAARHDWTNEVLFWISVLALLNTRNITEVVDGPDLSKLNRSRKKSGKGDLLVYRTCRVTKRVVQRIRSQGEPTSPSATRAHFVRGHFKLRSSGIFWWAPFLRGDKDLGFADKGYELSTPRPPHSFPYDHPTAK